MLAIRLPSDLEERLENLAKATGRTKTFYAREAIVAHLDDLEALYLAEQRLLDNRAGRSESVPLEEASRRPKLFSNSSSAGPSILNCPDAVDRQKSPLSAGFLLWVD